MKVLKAPGTLWEKRLKCRGDKEDPGCGALLLVEEKDLKARIVYGGAKIPFFVCCLCHRASEIPGKVPLSLLNKLARVPLTSAEYSKALDASGLK